MIEDLVLRRNGLVRIDAGQRRVNNAEAQTVLEEIFREGCRELCIHEFEISDDYMRSSVESWCHALGEFKSDELHTFIIDTYFQPLTLQAGVHCGDVSGLFRNFPNLRFVHIMGVAELAEISHGRLEKLSLMGDSLSPSTIEAILTGECPRLTVLGLGLAYEQRPAAGAVDALIDLARSGTDLPLKELHLSCTVDVEKLLRGLAGTPLLGQLDVLCLHNTHHDELVPVAMELHRELAHLDTFAISLDGGLETPDEDLRALGEVLSGLADSEDDEYAIFSPGSYGWYRWDGRDKP